MTTEQAKQILDSLMKRDFYNWYMNDFDEYLSLGDEAKSDEEIIEDIKKLFSRVK